MKKIISIFMVCVVFLTGCTSNSSSDLPESRYEVDSSRPMYTDNIETNAKLTWFIGLGWYDGSWGRDIVTQTITEQTGMEVEFIIGDIDQLNNLIASGDTPDLISIESGADLNNTPEKFAYPLNDLADAYSPYFTSDLVDSEYFGWYQKEDDKTYGYTAYAASTENIESGESFVNQAFYVRSDIYEELGSPSMATQEEFLQVLQDAKELMPKSESGKDMTGFCYAPGNVETGDIGAIGTTLQDFLGVPFINEDNTFLDRFADAEYLSWLDTLHEAYELGLISEDNFVYGQEDMNTEIRQGNCFAYLSSNVANDPTHISAFEDAVEGATYQPIDGFVSESGREHAFQTGSRSGWMVTYVSKDSEDPQSAFYMLEYLLTEEGYRTSTCGREGDTYNIGADGKCELTDKFFDELNSNPDAYQTLGTGYLYPMRAGDGISLGYPDINSVPHAFYQKWAVTPVSAVENIGPDAGTTEARNLTTLDQLKGEAYTTIIKEGNASEKAAAYQETEASYDIEAINTIRNEKIQANLEKAENL